MQIVYHTSRLRECVCVGAPPEPGEKIRDCTGFRRSRLFRYMRVSSVAHVLYDWPALFESRQCSQASQLAKGHPILLLPPIVVLVLRPIILVLCTGTVPHTSRFYRALGSAVAQVVHSSETEEPKRYRTPNCVAFAVYYNTAGCKRKVRWGTCTCL